MDRLMAFGVATLAFALFSRGSLRDTHSHGFFRFFAFESITGLILLNLRRWFSEPLSLRQLISWPILMGAGAMAIHGFHLLRAVGKPKAGLAGTETLIQGFENTSQLVTEGAYRYIRHPLYASLVYLAWGVFLKAPSRLGAFLALVASGSLVATAKVEERENLDRFGQPYADYMQGTRMFIPCLF